jgi:hypothetical protein
MTLSAKPRRARQKSIKEYYQSDHSDGQIFDGAEESLALIKQPDPDEKEFREAADEGLTSLVPIVEKESEYQKIVPILVKFQRIL